MKIVHRIIKHPVDGKKETKLNYIVTEKVILTITLSGNTR